MELTRGRQDPPARSTAVKRIECFAEENDSNSGKNQCDVMVRSTIQRNSNTAPLDEAKGGKKDDKGESDHDYGTSESNDDQDDE